MSIYRYANPNLYGHLYSSNSIKTNTQLVDAILRKMSRDYLPYDNKRGILDRAFDAISMPLYATAGIARGFVSDEINPLEGFVGGVRAGIPFGDGYEKGEHTWSKVLEDAGWKPTTTSGKIARGALGFVGDVMLDPLTYLSGGLSAIVRGTGRAGALASHGAKAKLTTEGAKEIIEGWAKSKGITMSPDEVMRDAEKLSRKSNDLAGFASEGGEISLKLKNAPFGEKLFGKYADKGFSWSADSWRAFGDDTVAPYYAKLRDSIYGSKIGELFSTVTPLYRASKESPERLYEFIKFSDIVRGRSADKLDAEKLIKSKAEELMGLSPAESKELLRLMEDKFIWSKVQHTMKFLDTKEAGKWRNAITKHHAKVERELNNILNKKKYLEEIDAKQDVKLFDANKELDALRDEYKETLANLDVKHVKDTEQVRQLINTYESEISSLTKETSVTKNIDDMGINPESIIAKFDNYINTKQVDKSIDKQLIELDKRYSAEKNINKQELNNIKEQYMTIKNSDMTSSVKKQKLDELKAQTDLLAERMKKTSSLFRESRKALIKQQESPDKIRLIENISTYLYGKPDFISKGIWDIHLESLVKMFKQGKSKDEIFTFIEDNAEYFSGRATIIYPFIGEVIGYGKGKRYSNWDEMYNKRIEALVKQQKDGIPLTPYQEEVMLQLHQLQFKRQLLISKFRRAKDMDEVKQIIQDYKNKELMDDYYNAKDSYNFSKTPTRNTEDVRRDRMLNEDVALEKRKTGEFKNKPPQKLTDEDKSLFYSDLIESVFYKYDIKDITDKQVKFANEVLGEVQPLLDNYFEKGYGALNVEQRELLRTLAIKNAYARSTGAKIIGGVSEREAKALIQEQQRRLNALKNDIVNRYVNEGTQVAIKIDDDLWKGIVKSVEITEDGKPLYNIVKNDGTLVEKIKPNQFIGIIGRSQKVITIDDVVRNSDVVKDLVNVHDDLSLQLNKAKRTLAELDDAHKSAKDAMLNRFIRRADSIKKNIEDIENTRKQLKQSIAKLDEGKVEELTRKLDKINNILINDDAFETYMKTFHKDAYYNAIYNSSYTTGEIVLDTRMDISDKVKVLAKMLRNDFVEIGKKEVDIGSLKPEQFEARMNYYLPHILTEDGEAFFKSNKELLQTKPHFSDMLGFGREWNPFAKSRTAKGTVEEINKYFSEKFPEILKGKNILSENIAEIYLTRMLKHTRLVYDNTYMESMLEMFGKEFNGVVEPGYKVVSNYGKLKETAMMATKLNMSVRISNDVTNWVRTSGVLKDVENTTHALMQNIPHSTNYDLRYKKLFNGILNKRIEGYIEQTYPDDSIRKLYNETYESFTRNSGVSRELDDMAVPLVQLDDVRIKSIQDNYKESIDTFDGHIRDKIMSYEKRKYYEKYNQNMSNKASNIQRARLQNLSLDELRDRVNWLIEKGDEVDAIRLNRIMKNIDTLSEVKPFQFKQVNEAIVQKANQARQLQIAKDQSRLLQLYDKFTHFIKLNQTTVIPAFHTRNKMSNMFNNWLEIGQYVTDLDLQRHTFLTVLHQGDIEKLKGAKTSIMNPDGSMQEISWSDLYQRAKEYDAVDVDFFSKDLGAGTQTAGKLGVQAKYDPTDTKNFFLYKKGAEVGSLIESQDRFLHFVAQLKRGKTFEEASESSRKFLFDYSDLTEFEATVMKRILPYYTWLRKNSALQLEMMLEQPKKYLYVSKVMGGIEGMVNEEDRINREFVNDFAKDWVQTPFYATNHEGRKEPVLWNPNLPFMDLGRIPDPFNPVESLSGLFTQTNPMLRVPIEQAMNRNVFFDSPIVKDGDNQLTRRADHVANNFAMYGIGKGFVNKSGVDFWLHALNSTSGLKFLSYDYDRYKAMKIQELIEKREQLKNERFGYR